jgi:hypothetical protein
LNESEAITLMQPKSSKYSAGQKVMLADGRSAKVVGVNPIDGSYQVITADNKSLRLKADDIDRIASNKDSKYQESGVDREDSNKLSIKDTPFDIEQDK